uniref:ATP synthase F0 subunit 8 n=1 Tax=Schizymenia dubyi TaxID=38368 RepID=A0A0E3DB69_9FLOR|nr:ATP synthase F0 subunit 8 [Schizymenia dubyi]
MPQLDRIIIFTQIFWLFTVFTIVYTILVHYFLPKFLKSLKSRKEIVLVNSLEVESLSKKITQKQKLLTELLHKNLILVKNILTSNFNSLETDKKLNLLEVDKKIGTSISNSTQYCDIHILNAILFYPKIPNF